MKKKSVKVVAGILVKLDSNPQFLLSLRQKGKPLEGYWEFPGGKIEQFETSEQALERECYEELGIVITPKTSFFLQEHHIDYTDFSVDLSFFQVNHWKGNPFGKEGQIIQWHQAREVRKLKTLPLVIDMVDEILRKTPEK